MPDIRVQDEQGNVHVFPDGSTPEMIAKAMGVKAPDAAAAAAEKPSWWSNPREAFTRRAAELGQTAQQEMNKAVGPEAEGKGIISRFGHRMASLIPETAAVVDKSAAGLMDWKNAAAVALGVVDPAIPAAYFGAQGTVGAAQGAADIAKHGATPENTQDTLLSAATAVSGAAAAGSPKAGTAFEPVKGAYARVKAPLYDTVGKPRGTVPAESFSPVELKAYADANGIPINAAQATEHNLPRNVQSTGERASVNGSEVRQQTKTAQAAVAQHTQRLMDQLSPNTPDVATAGTNIKQSVQAALEQELTKARQNYADVDRAATSGPTGPVSVELKAVKAEAQRLLDSSKFLREKVPSLDAKRAATVLKGITELPDNASFSQVQELRSALIDEAAHPENAISQQAQAWIKQMSGVTDSAMMDAAGSSPGLKPVFRIANEHWKTIQEDFNNPRSPLYQVLREPDPSKVPQKLTQQGQIGGSPYNVGLLDRYRIDKGPVKWAITGDMMKKNFGLYDGGKTLAGYSDQFLQSVFSPAELEGVYKTGAIARSTRMNTNPSGTAGVNSAVEDVTSVGAGKWRVPGAKAAAAAMTNSPAFNKWLMNNPEPPKTASPHMYSKWLAARHQALRAISLAAVTNAAASDQER